jgi:hypothetical protein
MMSDFVEQLRLAEKAAEDIYFAKVNRDLIRSLRKQLQAENDSDQASDQSNANERETDKLVGTKGTSGG